MADPQHLVEDDGLGEELRVVWELEAGVQVFERASLPDPTAGLEAPARLDAYLHAVRWGAIGSADARALHAPFRSGIAIEDYQLDPVARGLSAHPRGAAPEVRGQHLRALPRVRRPRAGLRALSLRRLSP
jgi:hypothetical protein